MSLLHNTQFHNDIRMWVSRKIPSTVNNWWTLVTRAVRQILMSHRIFLLTIYIFVFPLFRQEMCSLTQRYTRLSATSCSRTGYRRKEHVRTHVRTGVCVCVSDLLGLEQQRLGQAEYHSLTCSTQNVLKAPARKQVCCGTVWTLRAWPYIWKYFHLPQETVFFLNSKALKLLLAYNDSMGTRTTVTMKKQRVSRSNRIQRNRLLCREQKKNKKTKEVNEIPYLPSESRNVHGVCCEAHPKSHGWLNTKEPGNQLLHLLVDVQITWKWHILVSVLLVDFSEKRSSDTLRLFFNNEMKTLL